MNAKQNQKYQNMTKVALMQEYEAKYGIQGTRIYDLSRAELIDGLTNPAHIPARSR